MNNTIISLLSLRDMNRLIRREQRKVERLKKDLRRLQGDPMTQKEITFWLGIILSIWISSVFIAILYYY